MARKKTVAKKSTAVAERSASKGLTLPPELEERLRAAAEDEVNKETTGENNQIRWPMSGGEFLYQDESIGDVLFVIVVDTTYMNSYYDRPYSEDEPCPPACFAIADERNDLAPSENSPVPQCDTVCADCEWDAYGSDARGTAKACRNTRKLAVLDPEAPDDIVYINLPPTSMRSYGRYVRGLKTKHGQMPFSVVTSISFDEEKDYATFVFELESVIEDPALIETVLDARDNGAELLRREPDVSKYEEYVPPKRKTAKKKTARRR